MTAIINGAPMTYFQGIDDQSRALLVSEREAIPQHLPKVLIFAETGPLDDQLVVGASRINTFGANSFDERGQYTTHQTILSNKVNAQGNMHIVRRLKPADAPKPASIRLYADVLETSLPEFERNSDGSIKLDELNQPIPTGEMIPGAHKVKYIVGPVPLKDGEDQFGLGIQKAGTQTDEATTTQSIMFPIGDFEVPHFGKAGNNAGLRIWAPTVNSSNPLDDRLLTDQAIYPFRMGCSTRPDDLTTGAIKNTQADEQFVNVCFKKKVIDRNTDKKMFVGDVFVQAYQDLNSKIYAPAFGPFGRMHLYSDNVEELLSKFYAAEVPFIDSFSDFKGVDGEEHRFNMISGVSSSGSPYHSFQLVTGEVDSVRLTENSVIWAQGGGDGTMTNETHAQLAAEHYKEYADENSEFQNMALHPESIFYDSGYPLATKYAMLSALGTSQRKDLFVVLATHVVGQRSLTASEESSLAVGMRTRAQNYPESEIFSTPVVRCMIVGRSGTLLDSQFDEELPLTIELASKAAAFMGAANGKWDKLNAFDRQPNNSVDMFVDINVKHTPAKVRNNDWKVGLNWVEASERRTLYWPALKTVYDNDTSVLTSFFNALACCQLQKVGERARQRFSGAVDLTDLELVDSVNKFVENDVLDRFAGRYIIKPQTTITSADKARNYSWTTMIQIGMPGMKTVQTLYVQTKRIEEMTE